jgi:hypothetical protein
MKNASSGMLCHADLVRTDVSEEYRFLQEPHGVTSQKTAFFAEILVHLSYSQRSVRNYCLIHKWKDIREHSLSSVQFVLLI